MNKLKIAFYTPHMSLGGTEITMYDFADFNERLLGNQSVILYNNNHPASHISTIEKFRNRFDHMYALQGPPEGSTFWDADTAVPLIDEVIRTEQCDVLYMQKFGHNDGVVSNICKTCVLCAAPVCDPHGDVYAYVSEWLSEQASGGRYPAVPSMITPLPKTKEDFRKKLDIPENATVFARNGGEYGWNISWANDVLRHVVTNNPNIYFLFQNTSIPFVHEQIKHIEPTANLNIKTKLINTSNAMIHCRNEGESFGCACGEFSTKNKRVITFGGSKDRNHISLLGNKGLYYQTPQELYNILTTFEEEPEKDWNGYANYNPEKIMKTFNEIFLK